MANCLGSKSEWRLTIKLEKIEQDADFQVKVADWVRFEAEAVMQLSDEESGRPWKTDADCGTMAL